MAWALRGNGSGFFLTVTLVDTKNQQSTLEYELQSADMATAQTDATAILGKLALVSDSKAINYGISLRYEEDAFTFPVSADNNVRLRLVGQIKDQSEKAVFEIPAPKQTLFVASVGENSAIADLADTDLVNYVQTFQTGGESFISDGELLDFTLKGRKVARARGF